MFEVIRPLIRVLLVDPDPRRRQRFQALLDQAHSHGPFTLVQVPSVEAALEESHCVGRGVVLFDTGRARAAGLRALRRLVDCFAGEAVLALQRTSDEALGIAALHVGAQDCLAEPGLHADALARSIRFALERAQVRHELAREATIDPLTRVANRRGVEQRLAIELARRQRGGRDLHVALLDLDDFKRINDTLGHACGDAALKEVALRLNAGLRATDVAARIGGDEFLVLLPETGMDESLCVAERLRASIARPMHVGSAVPLRITASLGLAAVTGAQPTLDDLLRQTHLPLKRSKQLGKNRASLGSEKPVRGAVPAALREVTGLA